VDLGFWNTAFFNSISKAGSFFLSRLHGQSSVNIKEKKYLNFNLDIFLSKIPRDDVFEFCVYLGLEHKVKSRLICLPVPKEIADLRRKRLKEAYRKRGKTPSAKILKRLDWALFVTNVPYSVLPTSTIYTVYRIRWQVELTFKLAKQDAQLDHTLSHNPSRVMCEFYARLIALLQFKNLIKLLPPNSLHLVSCPKSWRNFKLEALDFFRYLRSSNFPSFIFSFISSLLPHCSVSKRLKSPSSLDLLSLASISPFNRFLLNPLAFLASQDHPNTSIAPLFITDYSFNSLACLSLAA
jgi:hypothetical protein